MKTKLLREFVEQPILYSCSPAVMSDSDHQSCLRIHMNLFRLKQTQLIYEKIAHLSDSADNNQENRAISSLYEAFARNVSDFGKHSIEFDGDSRSISTNLEATGLRNGYLFSRAHFSQPIFVMSALYQIMSLLEKIHDAGLSHGDLNITNLYVNNLSQVFLGLPNFETCSIPKEISIDPVSQLSAMLVKWINWEVSNFDYLMFLNHLAGRRQGNPSNSPLLPWVTDFTVQNGAYRDLRKTKFEICKGTDQMDASFLIADRLGISIEHLLNSPARRSDSLNSQAGIVELSARISSGKAPEECTVLPGSREFESYTVPHHLLDMMSDLTFYTYRARRTEVELLRRFVRREFRPSEFPTSIERLYASTPDECIPEFYSDATIFHSIHRDMLDLSVPSWCNSTEEFIHYHRNMLESEHVSERLHHWIDLYFGFRLLGDEAVAAKNVHHEMVERKQNKLRQHGITCLFHVPHPRRRMSRATAEAKHFVHHQTPLIRRRPQPSSISHTALLLPEEFDALELIRRFEEVQRFHYSVSGCFLDEALFQRPPDSHPNLGPLTQRKDLESVACLAVEMLLYTVPSSFVPTNLILLAANNHEERVNRARTCYRNSFRHFPNVLSSGVECVLRPFTRFADDNWTGPVKQYEGHAFNERFLPSAKMLFRHVFKFPRYLVDLQWSLALLEGGAMDEKMAGPLSGALSPHVAWDGTLGTSYSLSNGLRIMELFEPHLTAGLKNDAADVGFNVLLRALLTGRLVKLFAALGGRLAVRDCLYKKMLAIGFRLLAGQETRRIALALFSPEFLRQLAQQLGLKAFRRGMPQLLVLGLGDTHSQTVDTRVRNWTDERCGTESTREDNETAHDVSALLETGSGSDQLACLLKPDSMDAESMNVMDSDRKSLFSVKSAPACLQEPRTAGGSKLPIASFSSLSSDFSSEMESELAHAELELHQLAASSLIWLATAWDPRSCTDLLLVPLVQSIAAAYRKPGMLAVQKAVGFTLQGDELASRALDILHKVAKHHGGQFVSTVYYHRLTVVPLRQSLRELEGRSMDNELMGRLLASMVLLTRVLRWMPDAELSELINQTDLKALLACLIGIASSPKTRFAAGVQARRALLIKLIAAISALGTRLGFESSRRHLVSTFQIFFHQLAKSRPEKLTEEGDEEDAFPNRMDETPIAEGVDGPSRFFVRLDSETSEFSVSRVEQGSETETKLETDSSAVSFSVPDVTSGLKEVRSAFDPPLVRLAYTCFSQLVGASHLEQSLLQPEVAKAALQEAHSELSDQDNNLSSSKLEFMPNMSSVEIVGDLELSKPWQSLLRECFDSGEERRRFHCTSLFTFSGHSSAIRSVDVNATESLAMSASADRSVQLWSLEDALRGRAEESTAKFVYRGHLKSVFGCAFIPGKNIAASCDGSLHLWDLNTGRKLHAKKSVSSNKSNSWNSNLCALTTAVIPMSGILVADSKGSIHLLDPRCRELLVQSMSSCLQVANLPNIVHGWNQTRVKRQPHVFEGFDKHLNRFTCCSVGTRVLPKSSEVASAANARLLCASQSGFSVLAAGLQGVISSLDLRTGQIIYAWRAHTDAVMQLQQHESGWYVSCGQSERNISLWRPHGADVLVLQLADHANPCESQTPRLNPSCLDVHSDGITLIGHPATSMLDTVIQTTELSGSSSSSGQSYLCEYEMLDYSNMAEEKEYNFCYHNPLKLPRRGQITAIKSLDGLEFLLGSSSGSLNLFA